MAEMVWEKYLNYKHLKVLSATFLRKKLQTIDEKADLPVLNRYAFGAFSYSKSQAPRVVLSGVNYSIVKNKLFSIIDFTIDQ